MIPTFFLNTLTSVFLSTLQFNSKKPITSDHPSYIHDPLLKDRIHCVVLVFDISSVEHLSYGMVAKIKRVRKMLIKCGECHLVFQLEVTD